MTPNPQNIMPSRHMSKTDMVVMELSSRDEKGLPPLEPGTVVYDSQITKDIEVLKEHEFIRAALHLMNDDIEGCHKIVGSVSKQPDADVMHACLHRREGDYWNAKYWYNSLPKHPLIPSKQASKAFVDACERVKKDGEDDTKLRETQWEELRGIVKYMREKYSK